MDPASRGAFDPLLYPRTYRFGVWRRFLIVAFCGVGLAGELFLSIPHDVAHATDWLPALVLLPVAGLFCYMIVSALKFRVVLFADAIEIGAFRMKRLRRDEISCGQVVFHKGWRTVRLFQRGSQLKWVDVPTSVVADDAFLAWFNAIPDLDAQPGAGQSHPGVQPS